MQLLKLNIMNKESEINILNHLVESVTGDDIISFQENGFLIGPYLITNICEPYEGVTLFGGMSEFIEFLIYIKLEIQGVNDTLIGEMLNELRNRKYLSRHEYKTLEYYYTVNEDLYHEREGFTKFG